MEKFDYVVRSVMFHKKLVSLLRMSGDRMMYDFVIGIFSSTVKKNILFGKEFDLQLFRRVARATALDAVC